MKTSDPQENAVKKLLSELEAELRRQNLWESAPPSSHQLSSTEPFCVDTLSLPQWLQWIFIPRIKAIMDGGGVLPSNCEIAPYAEQVLPEVPEYTDRVQNLIEKIDTKLS